ncbi:hypothetical protein CK203_065966 [Vitis vinifera]|uniref:Uncharacterized protein n=1 Tax=Vitis vinifera TaxID=29760 RepID=A0A438FNH1_VITVI|nr:hypothetical protein CK203_065966 [Vitis vinifera]
MKCKSLLKHQYKSMRCPICQSYEHLVEECPTIPTAMKKCLEIKQMSLDNSSPTTMLHTEYFQLKLENHPISPRSQGTSVYTATQPSPTSSNLEQAIVNLSKVWEILLEIRNPSMLNSVKELTV